jgi:hypothetical protein
MKAKRKADLTGLLAETAGSTRHRTSELQLAAPPVQASRRATKPITLHFPKEVRDQLKILAVQRDSTLHKLGAEAFNMLFAKYGKPEIAP